MYEVMATEVNRDKTTWNSISPPIANIIYNFWGQGLLFTIKLHARREFGGFSQIYENITVGVIKCDKR
jgi:hypothetical protein